jgi:hypothetical protein
MTPRGGTKNRDKQGPLMGQARSKNWELVSSYCGDYNNYRHDSAKLPLRFERKRFHFILFANTNLINKSLCKFGACKYGR